MAKRKDDRRHPALGTFLIEPEPPLAKTWHVKANRSLARCEDQSRMGVPCRGCRRELPTVIRYEVTISFSRVTFVAIQNATNKSPVGHVFEMGLTSKESRKP